MAIERVEEIYSSYSGVYDLLFDAILSPGRRRAIQAMEIDGGDRILEVGVGTGLSLSYYPAGCHVTGIDISLPMLQKAAKKVGRSRASVDLKRMSAEHLKWPDASFDKVLLSYVISCVERPEQVVREVHRVCRPGGRVLFLNHFHSSGRLHAWGERRLTPLTKRLGFVLDLPLTAVTGTGLFEIERIERVNLFGLWSLVSCTRR
ncbi:MAG TPA: methyltransferase domain-containing protein [Candidatus Polarisedimenticolia bacterium]|nr:methyltransferase domain-containing protein [Candidatus Polarisedimenticolia bacterium]